MVIPESLYELKCYYERLGSHVLVRRTVGGREVRFFIEPTRPGWFYPCTVDDICAVLRHLSPEGLAAFDFIVMRQPTRKQHILCPVWGRAIFYYQIASCEGCAIVLEAQNLAPIRRAKSLPPEYVRELARLRSDGHAVRKTRRGIEIGVTPEALRHTVLYRTLLHEIGHHVDYKRSSAQQWDGKTKPVKEDFAHRYAAETFATLRQNGAAPFPPIVDRAGMAEAGLRAEWFGIEQEGEAFDSGLEGGAERQ